MRYIDLDELVVPEGWLADATAAAEAVMAGADPNDFDDVWRELKDELAALFPDKKCWYCDLRLTVLTMRLTTSALKAE